MLEIPPDRVLIAVATVVTAVTGDEK